jgi:integrase
MRRANGEGSVYRLKDGRWRVSVSVRVAGKLHRISRTRRKRADCVALLDELRGKIGQSNSVRAASGTLAAYLDGWLANTVQPHLAANTFDSYERAVRLHVKPRLGTAKLAKLSPLHIEEFKAAMKADAVGPRAAQAAFQALRAALAHAVYPLRILPMNPCDGLKPPSHAKRKMRPFEASEMRLILEDTHRTRWHALYAVAFGCGLRIGELLGLEWDDVDWHANTITVNRQLLEKSGRMKLGKPKTRSSVRTIQLPANVKTALREHRALQSNKGLADCPIVFPTKSGKHLARSNFQHDEWTLRLARCGLGHRPFHNTRHTFATLTLLAGVPVAVVAKVLGHSSPAITYSVYSHTVPSMDSAAANAMERLFA